VSHRIGALQRHQRRGTREWRYAARWPSSDADLLRRAIARRQGSTREIKGVGELLTSRGNSGALKQRRGRREVSGRRRRSSDCTVKEPVSADRVNQRGSGQTRGCPALLAMRRSSPRQGTRQTLDGGHGTRRSSTSTRGERERARVFDRGHN
jgi:hypothetical protein